MPDKNYQLQQVQIGKESTWGTRVATTRELNDCTTCELQPEVNISEHRAMGSRAVVQRDITQTMGSASSEFNLSYNHLAMIMDSLFGTATPSGAGPYVRDYTAPDTADTTRSFYTLLFGDATDANSLSGALASALTITAASGEYVTASVDWAGREVAGDTLDSVAPDTNLTYILPQHVDIKLGNLGGALTSLGCDAISVELSINTNTTVRAGLGSVSGCDYNMGDLEIEASVTATADNATAKALYEALRGTSPSLSKQDMTIIFQADSNNIAQFDMPVTLKEAPALYGNEDGTATVEMVFGAYRDVTGTSSFSSSCDVSITNQEATLP